MQLSTFFNRFHLAFNHICMDIWYSITMAILFKIKWLLFRQPDALLQDYCSGTLCFALGSEPRLALPRPQGLGAHNRLCHVP